MTGERFEPRIDPRPNDNPWPSMVWPIESSTVLRGRFVSLAPGDPERDSDELFEALDDDLVWSHVRGRPNSPDDVRTQLARARDAFECVQWVVRAAAELPGVATGDVLGRTSYLDVAPADARLEIGSTGYRRAVWASVVNPEVKLLLLEFAFDVLGAGRVQLKTDIRNTRSQQAIARLGAQFEGVLRRHARRADGSIRDSVLFSITADDWPRVRDGLVQRVDSAGAR